MSLVCSKRIPTKPRCPRRCGAGWDTYEHERYPTRCTAKHEDLPSPHLPRLPDVVLPELLPLIGLRNLDVPFLGGEDALAQKLVHVCRRKRLDVSMRQDRWRQVTVFAVLHRDSHCDSFLRFQNGPCFGLATRQRTKEGRRSCCFDSMLMKSSLSLSSSTLSSVLAWCSRTIAQAAPMPEKRKMKMDASEAIWVRACRVGA